MKVACFCVAAMDLFPQQNAFYAGGNSLNQAIRFSRLGCRSAFTGALGTDDAGNRIAALLTNEHVDCSHMYRIEGATASNRIVNDAAGERFGVDGAWNSGVYEAFRPSEHDWTYLSTFDVWATHANSPFYQEVLEHKLPSQLLAVDFLHLRDYDLLALSLRAADIVFFGGTPDMADDLARIARTTPEKCIVLTLGAGGSIAFTGERVVTQPALPVEKVVDTTGCGDAFQAGFTECFYRTRDVAASLSAGAELGRVAARHFGGAAWGSIGEWRAD